MPSAKQVKAPYIHFTGTNAPRSSQFHSTRTPPLRRKTRISLYKQANLCNLPDFSTARI